MPTELIEVIVSANDSEEGDVEWEEENQDCEEDDEIDNIVDIIFDEDDEAWD